MAATKAAGCLLEPEPGDTVLVSEDAPGQAFILAVLTRAGGGPARIARDLDLTLGGTERTVTLAGRELNLGASETLRLTAPEVSALAEAASLRVGTVGVVGATLSMAFETISAMAGSVEETVGRLVSRVRRVYRRVDEFERARVGRLRIDVAEGLDLTAEKARIRAKKNVDIDGKKINLG